MKFLNFTSALWFISLTNPQFKDQRLQAVKLETRECEALEF